MHRNHQEALRPPPSISFSSALSHYLRQVPSSFGTGPLDSIWEHTNIDISIVVVYRNLLLAWCFCLGSLRKWLVSIKGCADGSFVKSWVRLQLRLSADRVKNRGSTRAGWRGLQPWCPLASSSLLTSTGMACNNRYFAHVNVFVLFAGDNSCARVLVRTEVY